MFEDKVIVSQLMTKKVIVASKSNKLSQVLEFFTETNITHLIITENDVLEGILSIKDLLKFIKKGLSGDSSVTLTELDKTFSIEDMMTKNPIVLSPEQDVNDARELLSEGKFSALPVVKDGLIVGIISIKDVIRFDNTL